jgi:hypothetical protein
MRSIEVVRVNAFKFMEIQEVAEGSIEVVLLTRR